MPHLRSRILLTSRKADEEHPSLQKGFASRITVVKSSRPVMALPRRSLPAMAKVRQQLPSDHIVDVRMDVNQKLREFGLRDKIKPGYRIAITAGSRGIGGLVELLSGIADA